MAMMKSINLKDFARQTGLFTHRMPETKGGLRAFLSILVSNTGEIIIYIHGISKPVFFPACNSMCY